MSIRPESTPHSDEPEQILTDELDIKAVLEEIHTRIQAKIAAERPDLLKVDSTLIFHTTSLTLHGVAADPNTRTWTIAVRNQLNLELDSIVCVENTISGEITFGSWASQSPEPTEI